MRRAAAAGPRRGDESISDYLARVGHGPETAHDGVADPIGQGLDVYTATAATISALVDRLVGLLWPGEG